jgi:uncharacterized protein (DUF1697 family)
MTPRPAKPATDKMATHVAFLRAINVGGHAQVSMTALTGAFEAAGGVGVKTFLQSGNIAFKARADAEGAARAAIQRNIQTKLDELLGKDVVVIFRTLRELENMLKADPFKDAANGQDVTLYVTLLAGKPRKPVKLPLDSPKDGLEIVHADKLDVFVVSRPVKGHHGYPNILVEKTFGVPATTRNWNTITRIVKHFS